MLRKIIISSMMSFAIFILGAILQENKIAFQADIAFAQDNLTAQELRQEIQKKGLKISAGEAVKIVEEETGGQVIAARLRRIKDGKLGYAFMVLKKEPISIEVVVVHGNTGEVLVTTEIEFYPIVVPGRKLM
jgi:uncharacterized membrane protein YkoI